MTEPWNEFAALTTYEQRELYDAMSDISEECYCAGWMRDCEYDIWRLIHDGGDYGRCGFKTIEGEQALERVRRAMLAANCWIVWATDGAEPITLDAWAARVAARVVKP